MASYNELNALIDAYINRNGVQAITGQILNGVLKAMVEQLGRGYTIMGAAIPTTDPGTPDGPECYFASETGTYTDFDGLQVAPGELALLCYTPSDGWTKATIYEGFRQVGATIDGNVGTPSVGVSYANGVLSFDFRNMKGNTGDQAGFGTIGADIAGGVGTPGVSVESSGPATAKNLQFHFTNLKGETGVTSVVATVDNTTGTPTCTVSLEGQQLTLAFSGLKGAQGDTGSSVDYPFTIVNNLTTDDATQALSAAQGVVLEGEITQLEAKVDGLDGEINAQYESGKYLNNNGTTTNDADWAVSEYIPVTAGRVYNFYSGKQNGNAFLCVYNSSNAVIDWYYVRATSPVRQVTIVNNGVKVKFSFYLPNISDCSVLDTADNKTIWKPGIAPKTDTINARLNGVGSRVGVLESGVAALQATTRKIDVDFGQFEAGKYLNSDGTTTANADWAVSEDIPVVAGQVYTFYSGKRNNSAYLCVYNANNQVINWYSVRATYPLRQVTINNAGVKVKFSFHLPSIFNVSVYDDNAFGTLWRPNLNYKTDNLNERIGNLDAITWTEYNVSTATDLKNTLIGLMAVTPDPRHWYKVNIAPGTYDVDVSGDSVPGSNGLFVMPYCVLNGAGKDKTILQFHYSGTEKGILTGYSTLNSPYTCQVKNMTLSAKNVRYAFHSDGEDPFSFGRDDTDMLFENVRFVHLGFDVGAAYSAEETYNTGDYVFWGGGLYRCIADNTVGKTPSNTTYWENVYYSPDAFGSGIKSGCSRTFIGCEFIGHERADFFIHNSTNQAKEYSVTFDSCIFAHNLAFGSNLSHRDAAIALNSAGNTAKGRCYVKNCTIESYICNGQTSNSVTTLDWEIICDNDAPIWADAYNDAYKKKHYTKFGVRNALFLADVVIGSIVQKGAKNGTAELWDGTSPILGILLNDVDVSEDGVGCIATKGCRFPITQILGATFTAGSWIGYDGGSWVLATGTIKPIIYTEDGHFGYYIGPIFNA